MSDNNNCISNDVVFRVANENDTDAILEFLRKHFYPDEPLIMGNESKQQSSKDEEFSISLIPSGTSIVAIDTDNQIIGVKLAGPAKPGDAEEMLNEAKLCKDKKWSEILNLLAYVEIQANVFERYNVDRALYMQIISVHSKFRGKSIALKMTEKCMDIGRKLGYQLAKCICTSIYAAQFSEKLQMDCVYELAYKDYKDNSGKQVFHPPSPHTHIKAYAQRL